MAWTGNEVRPGLYLTFKEAAIAQITGGARGIVAIPLVNYGTATTQTFYTVTTEKEATDLFGSANIRSIKLALQAGAKEVLVYTLQVADGTTVTQADAYADARAQLDTRPFNVFVFDEVVTDAIQDSTLAWVQTNRDESKHFFAVFGGDATTDADPTAGNSRSTRLADDYAVNLISGREYDGTTLNSTEFSPYIAGKVAGAALNESITYDVIPADDVTKRLTNSEIVTALQAGSLVLVNDGEKVKIEQGLTTSVDKIRNVSARQAVSTDITKTARDSFIGVVNNDEDGQYALISAVKNYLENLEVAGVLTDIQVGLDPQYDSIGDKVYLAIGYRELDSMERIFLTINI